MKQIDKFPCSQALDEYIHDLCPMNAHMLVTMRGIWASDSYNGRFTGLFRESETTRCNVVRSFTYDNQTFWTLEKWEHDNGYRCELVKLTKEQFTTLIHS